MSNGENDRRKWLINDEDTRKRKTGDNVGGKYDQRKIIDNGVISEVDQRRKIIGSSVTIGDDERKKSIKK